MSVWFRSVQHLPVPFSLPKALSQLPSLSPVRGRWGVISGPSPWSGCSHSPLTACGWEGPRKRQDLGAGFTLLSRKNTGSPGAPVPRCPGASRRSAPSGSPAGGRTVTGNCGKRAREHRCRAPGRAGGRASEHGVYKAFLYFITSRTVYSLQWLQGNWISFVLLAK